MPADPICIMTATGMQCMSSPLKSHSCGADPCAETKVLGAQDNDIDAIRTFFASYPFERGLLSVSPQRAEIIARVAYLMAVSDVLDDKLPFVICRSRGEAMSHFRPLGPQDLIVSDQA